jgi:hypothetical protein
VRSCLKALLRRKILWIVHYGGVEQLVRKMVFTLGAGMTTQTCKTAATNSKGHGSCTIDSVKQPKGDVLVTISFAGDPRGPKCDYAPTISSTVITVKK